ncbi:MAG TPA: glycerol-3-phosphate dehydrogenase/oxidase [Gemmatimonadales bacterium]|nr:glycerol-3-phosphate dehydrogenase/oxidase [Gemmatimonadales bacterium]
MTPSVRASLRDLGAGGFDLLVIGGGITGAGIAREAALRGLSTALVEARDFGEGTSSRSSRLIHGGLRYLEQRRLHLVWEALRERRILLRLAPHLVRPLPFILPVFQGDRVPRWKVSAGLALYDVLAAGGNVRRHRTLGKRDLLLAEPLLRERGLTGGAMYFDAQCDDARLVVATVRAAAVHGARVANHVRVTGLISSGAGIAGAFLRDELSGETGEVRARVVVNATGPWTDELRRMEDANASPLIRPTKGVHVMVPRARIGNRNAVIFTSPVDGRVMFVLPWGEWSYIGTTDTDSVQGPDAVTADEGDVLYLLRSANALFPSARLEHSDIISTWAGLRPLLAADPSAAASTISREHRIVRGPGGLLTIAGGKLTTWRRMAAQLTDQVVAILGQRHGPGRAASETEPLPGGETTVLDGFRGPGLELGLSEATVDHLLAHFGAETPAIYNLCRERPTLARPLHPEHPAIEAEVVFAAEREFAMRADDVLERRLHLATETRDHGASARPRVTELLAETR